MLQHKITRPKSCLHLWEVGRVIYDGQPGRKREPNNISEVDEQNESAQQNDQPSHTTPKSPTIIE